MKLINSTFTLNGVHLSMAQVQNDIPAADRNLRAFIGAFGNGGTPRDVDHNVVIHGVDGPGESLNKVKKISSPKKKKATAK